MATERNKALHARRIRRLGFTLVEMMLAITILAVIVGVAYFSFDAGVRAWRAGTELADNINHADYVLEQIVMGLRSAYYPDAGGANPNYGFSLDDDESDGASARDVISWVKLGSALVGADTPFAGIPHRVEISVRDPDTDKNATGSGFAVRAWRIDAQPEDFDPDEEVEPFFLTSRVIGMNCRTLANEQDEDAEELEWEDEWEDTNRVPFAVEITLYLQPERKGGEPVAVQRIAEIPLAPLSWADKGIKSPIAWNPNNGSSAGSTTGNSGRNRRDGSGDSPAKSTGSGAGGAAGSENRTTPGVNGQRRLPGQNTRDNAPGNSQGNSAGKPSGPTRNLK